LERDKKKTKQNKNEVQIGIDKIKEEYQELFNKKIVEGEESVYVKEAKEKVNTYRQALGDTQMILNLKIEELGMIIKTLKNNKSMGFSETTNEMYKYGGKYALLSVKIILEKIIEFGQIPYFFNTAKTMAVIKDNKGSTFDINNTRPISVSDALTNIFEKMCLSELNKTHIDSTHQFGFKRNS